MKTKRKTNETTKHNQLISIVVPVFNAERFISETIKSVQAQSYSNWELILIDDKSTDNSAKIIREFAKKDKRITVINKEDNTGAADSRNIGISASNGAFLCFLDADDLWHRDKLKKQLQFMIEKKCAFSFTGYEFTDANGCPNGKKVYVPNSINYRQALKNTTISTITVMFDMSKLTKTQIYMPKVESEDTATWWKILKQVDRAYGLNEILSFYRRGIKSHSSNKLKAVKQVWDLYRKTEKIGLLKSIYCFCGYAINAVGRRI